MAFTEHEVIPTLIENTIMLLRLEDGNPYLYKITPVEGYVLHDNLLDAPVWDEYGNETGEIVLGYYAGTRTVPARYDFTANPREFYAVPRDSVPADQIFNVEPDHEIA